MRQSHLTRRGAVYTARFKLPKDLAARLGVAELRKSLHTADIAVARQRCLKATVWFRAEVERLRAMANPTRDDLEEAARRFFGELARQLDRPRSFDPDFLDLDIAENEEASKDRIDDLDAALSTNEFGRGVQVAAVDLLAGSGIDPAALDPRTQLVAYQLAARALRAQMQLFIHQLRNPAGAFSHTDPLFMAVAAPAPPPMMAASRPLIVGDALGVAVRDYLAKKAVAIGQSQHDEVARALRWLGEALGEKTPLAAVTKEQLRGFRDDVARIDVTLRGRDAPFHHRLTNVPERQIKSATAIRYWKSVQALWRWAVDEGLRPDDPSAGLKLEAKKGERPRTPEPFSGPELKKLFRTPLYAGYLSPRRVDKPGMCRTREGHGWFGLIALHTGLRAGELCQLLPGDFMFDTEPPHLKVREDDGAGQRVKRTKSEAATRDVPLHPDLIALGLRVFVEGEAKRYPEGRVFRVFKLGQGDRTSDGATRFWGRYLREYGLWKPGRSTHVFRHTVAHYLRAAGASDEDIGAVLGHAGLTVTAGYGGAQPLGRKAKTLGLLDYGFSLVEALNEPGLDS